ncbi:MAG: HD domain protein [Candidatus Woesebacteria bacterium GW2011_GWA1_37_8]|uniref:HD domain protein n=2 Tax=Candidatus Woeseibacteriota TaxID=1752722 RepID=A0A0G0LEM2_9BACT|nr:MAG: seg [Microgenomates group bacterium GW2011_GWC1_37_12b]KKQ43817.1 MAG: HD domain protein [Candidatus Woesebacteria bacterium GW2011_GWA1_37_8]KKQ86385.1 MAG: HD domain protein [Candidatus Woesebacteria bacterium GW2011_GWB1_38_8b]
MGKQTEGLVGFLHKCRAIKETIRYSNNDLVERKDTVASHSWRASEIGVLLAPYLEDKGVSSSKVTNMLVLHDLLEIESPEVEALGHRDKKAKVKREQEVAKTLFEGYEGEWKDSAQLLLTEFLEQTTLEAKIAKVIENYESNMHVIEEVEPIKDPEHRKLTIDYIERRRGIIPIIDELIDIQLKEIEEVSTTQ